MKRIIIIALTASVLSAQVPAVPDTGKSFYAPEMTIDQLRRDMDELRDELRRYQNKVNVPVIREEIKKLVPIPALVYEVVLRNGTVIQGDILEENIDMILFRTQIGELKLDRSQIRSIAKIKKSEPKLTIRGPIAEKTYADKKVFTGTIVNEGDMRADFVRIVFSLFQESTGLVGQDSCFVLGSDQGYATGVRSMSSIPPGGSAQFQCTVATGGKPVGYYTQNIHFEMFEAK